MVLALEQDTVIAFPAELIESFNGSFRDECLNETLFSALCQARATITAW